MRTHHVQRGEAACQVFVVHHRPDSGKYWYLADPHDAVASANAMIREKEGNWYAGNCHRMLRPGDLLLYKFGGARLRHEPGIYAAARVARIPVVDAEGAWVFRMQVDAALTRRLMRSPIVGARLERIVARSYGASIQPVAHDGRSAVASMLGAAALTRRPGEDLRELSRGLLIMKEPLDKILAGTKTWEIRNTAVNIRGPIALIESGSGHVVGVCELVASVGPLSAAEFRRNHRRHGNPPDVTRGYGTRTHAWVVQNARRLPKPVPYEHPSGAIKWVKLDHDVLRRVRALAGT